MKVIPETLRAH